ncbi:hypothetical protein EZ449_10930 [Pedobacter frigidisoli]|uniref:Uncharacterized protein n=1 Tax=Pedobacter frigidisoli TaxID=2530455 RepID=A0A4R0P4W5_9SPHI|nr:hypothetical protein [Pedobacter frigidisoli]TCD10324.1 hypothetical protein EZ449_10930 [Pedobacter frigidisoli]
MVSFKWLLILWLAILSSRADCKEFSNLEEYLNIYPTGKHNGTDGHWLKTDREKQTEIWNQANKINLKKLKGYSEYQDIYQRCDFYKWFGHKTDSLGFETRWAEAAKETTSKLKKLLNPIAVAAGNSNKEIEEFVNTGNRVIFDDIWNDLKSLYEHEPLKKADAETWDGHLLLKEQNLIDPYYRKLSEASLKKLQKLLRKETTFAKILPGFEFEGNLLSIQDRWLYGMKMMHYQNPDINR